MKVISSKWKNVRSRSAKRKSKVVKYVDFIRRFVDSNSKVFRFVKKKKMKYCLDFETDIEMITAGF